MSRPTRFGADWNQTNSQYRPATALSDSQRSVQLDVQTGEQDVGPWSSSARRRSWPGRWPGCSGGKGSLRDLLSAVCTSWRFRPSVVRYDDRVQRFDSIVCATIIR